MPRAEYLDHICANQPPEEDMLQSKINLLGTAVTLLVTKLLASIRGEETLMLRSIQLLGL